MWDKWPNFWVRVCALLLLVELALTVWSMREGQLAIRYFVAQAKLQEQMISRVAIEIRDLKQTPTPPKAPNGTNH